MFVDCGWFICCGFLQNFLMLTDFVHLFRLNGWYFSCSWWVLLRVQQKCHGSKKYLVQNLLMETFKSKCSNTTSGIRLFKRLSVLSAEQWSHRMRIMELEKVVYDLTQLCLTFNQLAKSSSYVCMYGRSTLCKFVHHNPYKLCLSWISSSTFILCMLVSHYALFIKVFMNLP